jgi:hypothetical protein
MDNVRRKSFKPKNTIFTSKNSDIKDSSSSENEASKSSDESGDNIIYKGGDKQTILFDLGETEEQLKELRKFDKTKINTLQGQVRKNFKNIVSWVNLLHDDVESYKQLYELVHKYFSDCTNIIPGTIGGYFAGCIVPTSFSGESKDSPIQGCSVICAGSMPKPKDDSSWAFCSNPVILGTFNGKNFTFTILNKTEKMDKGLIFLNYNEIDEFPGFSDKEKSTIIKNGIKEVKLIGYLEKDGKQYKDLLGGAIYVENIKSRIPTQQYQSEITDESKSKLNKNIEKELDSTSSCAISILSILLILLIVSIIIYAAMKKN